MSSNWFKFPDFVYRIEPADAVGGKGSSGRDCHQVKFWRVTRHSSQASIGVKRHLRALPDLPVKRDTLLKLIFTSHMTNSPAFRQNCFRNRLIEVLTHMQGVKFIAIIFVAPEHVNEWEVILESSVCICYLPHAKQFPRD